MILSRTPLLPVGLIGAGLVGQKRAAQLGGARLVAISDKIPERAAALAKSAGAEVAHDWETLVRRSDVEAVIVSTTHDALTPCAIAALESGKHVLVEKPAGRNLQDLDRLLQAAKRSKKIIRVGFNHRFHPGFQKAKALLAGGDVGDLMYIRARYGHGGRLGYEKEWRAIPTISGGGELLDQGMHLIDLCRWLGGEWHLGWGRAKTFFWSMPVEDNAFLFLESPDRQRAAYLHVSCTEWKNIFDFEIFGKTGKLEISGLGRSYGSEELRYYRMKPEMGPPELQTFPFPAEDASWASEFQAFQKEMAGEKTDIGTLEDAWRAMEVVSQVYDQSAATFQS
jgi:predicted dehydrogenase